ncbi:hypothetical protein [Phytohabitans aurantiacus]|jgi:hypothetical protein|nr:hypothetical protein [Phytohabitans aurantiacus]
MTSKTLVSTAMRMTEMSTVVGYCGHAAAGPDWTWSPKPDHPGDLV